MSSVDEQIACTMDGLLKHLQQFPCVAWWTRNKYGMFYIWNGAGNDYGCEHVTAVGSVSWGVRGTLQDAVAAVEEYIAQRESEDA